MNAWLIAGVLIAATDAAFAQTVVVDGNTLRLDDRTVRLWGMDAPDADQTCSLNWPAGRESRGMLASLVHDKAVECVDKSRDRPGRTLALCRANGEDVGAAMVRAGMAWADLPTTHRYVVLEAQATADYLGVHAHHCKTAWDWRARHRVEPLFERQ